MEKRSGTEYFLFCTLYFFLGKVLVKIIPRVPVYEIIFFRALVSSAICSYFIHKKNLNFFGPPGYRSDLLFRGLFGTISMIAFFYSLQTLPLGTVTALLNLSPIFTILIAGIFLKEKTKKQDWILFFIAFMGVVLLKGVDSEISAQNLLIGIFSALFSAIAYNFIRKVKTKVDPHVIVFSLSFMALPIVSPLFIMHWTSPTWSEWPVIIAIAFLTQAAQMNLTRATQTAKSVSSIMSYTYLDVVASVIVGYFLFFESFTLMTVTGIAIIISSVYLLRQSEKKAALTPAVD